jgi:hypothetical protein
VTTLWLAYQTFHNKDGRRPIREDRVTGLPINSVTTGRPLSLWYSLLLLWRDHPANPVLAAIGYGRLRFARYAAELRDLGGLGGAGLGPPPGAGHHAGLKHIQPIEEPSQFLAGA